MADQPTTNQDIRATLATIEEQIRVAADPELLTEGARVKLGEMYTAAEAANDQAACTAIQKAWDDIQALAVDAKGAREFALTAMDVLGTVQGQRDDALNELKELSDALDHMDTDNEKIADFVESIQEAIDEEDAMWYDERVEDTIFEQLQDALCFDETYEEHIKIFLEIFRCNIEVLPNRKREFYAWLKAVEADNAAGDDDDE